MGVRVTDEGRGRLARESSPRHLCGPFSMSLGFHFLLSGVRGQCCGLVYSGLQLCCADRECFTANWVGSSSRGVFHQNCLKTAPTEGLFTVVTKGRDQSFSCIVIGEKVGAGPSSLYTIKSDQGL
jgi:hypothetical protein